MLEPSQLLIVFLLVSFYLRFANLYQPTPFRLVLGYWSRWILFGLVGALFMDLFGVGGRPFWVQFSIAFLAWFLIENGFRWMQIKALSHSDYPLFPKYIPNTTGDEWPVHPAYFKLRDWLKEKGFKKECSLKAVIVEPLVFRSTFYISEDRKTRVQVTFFPRQLRGVTSSLSFSSVTPDHDRVVTDNQYVPYGGFYPDNWFVQRLPLVTSAQSLYETHLKRLQRSGGEFVEFEKEPLDDLNDQIRYLEEINRKQGFLLTHTEYQQSGRLSPEGRYRILKEIWLLYYLGKTLSGR